MISFVRGTVTTLGPEQVVVDVGGIGLALQCTPATIASLRAGEPATVPAVLVVREDSLTLFGFADDDERAVFEAVQTVSGIGPRLAQSILAVLRPDDLRRAVAADDLAVLTRVPGIGRKGAARLALELKDRLGLPSGQATSAADPSSAGGWRSQVSAALVGLGWSTREADAALDAVAAEQDVAADPDVGGLLKAALRHLDRT